MSGRRGLPRMGFFASTQPVECLREGADIKLTQPQVARLRRIMTGAKWCPKCRDYHFEKHRRRPFVNVDGKRIS